MAEETLKLIKVKSNTEKLGNKIAIFEKHPDHPLHGAHPGGDVSIHGDREYTVAETDGILAAIHDGRLLLVGGIKKSK